jgi:hypothetical protein
LEYQVAGKKLKFRWNNVVDGFNLPVKVMIDGKDVWLEPTQEWKDFGQPVKSNSSLSVDPDFYVTFLKLAK